MFRITTILMPIMLSSGVCADVITVDDDDPLADFATIQEAVDVAVDGDRIEVQPGYYFSSAKSSVPVVSVDGKSIEIVAVNLDPSLTVIAGQGFRRCVEWRNASVDSKLIGFTLDNGYSLLDGGGVLLEDAAVQIGECVFENCIADNGGGISSTSEAFIPPLAFDCTFRSNSASIRGGAVDAEGGFDLTRCTFEDCTSGTFGGGVSMSGDPAGKSNFSIIEDCEFRRCESDFGGGFYGVTATLRFADGDFFDCIAGDSFDLTGWGGGMAILRCDLRLNGGTFSACEGGQSSGGLDVDQSTSFVADVQFSGCTGWNNGGAVYAFGSDTALSFEDCMFDGNMAAEGAGGAILCQELVDAISLVGCGFDENLAFGGGYCLAAPNIVTAIDCDFNAQQMFESPVHHVMLSGVDEGSRFEGCRFIGAEGLDLASSFRATGIGGLEFVNCLFQGNRTVDVGGGIDTEGTVFISASPDDDSPISFDGCQFLDNRICCAFEQNNSGTGGAVRIEGRRASFSNSVLDSNRAAIAGSLQGTLDIANCIIDGRTSVGSGGAAVLFAGSTVVDSRISGNADCNYPAIEALGPVTIDGCTISGSFGLPFFCLEEPIELAVCKLGGDSTVQDTRFCDYTESAIAGAWTDLGGNSFNPAECNAADLNGDGQVDGADLARILARWGQSCLGCAEDVNQDGEVNGADLAGILAGWGG